MNSILHSKPWITESDITAVAQLIRSGMLAQGEKTTEFEAALGQWVGAENDRGVAVGSGSAATVLALRALRVGAGDEVVLPSYVSAQVFEAVITTGAIPVLCDIGEHWTVTPENVSRCMSKTTKVLIIPHLYGIFAQVESFRQFGIPIIEDCAQAIGDRGECRISGDIAVFSFHPTKLITTGEGGMAVSSDPQLVRQMRAIRDGAADRHGARLFSPLSDLASVLGLNQLSRFSEALSRRRQLARKYRAALEGIIPGSFLSYPWERSMFYRFPIEVDGGLARYGPLFARKGIHVRRGVDELVHRHANLPDKDFQGSVALYKRTVSLPLYPAMTDDDHDFCRECAIEIFSNADRKRKTHSRLFHG